jgi:hypothetical protein
VTVYAKENDSILKNEFQRSYFYSFLSFKDTIGGTKITWKTIGKMSFRMKVSTIFDGGMNKILAKPMKRV